MNINVINEMNASHLALPSSVGTLAPFSNLTASMRGLKRLIQQKEKLLGIACLHALKVFIPRLFRSITSSRSRFPSLPFYLRKTDSYLVSSLVSHFHSFRATIYPLLICVHLGSRIAVKPESTSNIINSIDTSLPIWPEAYA